jgi:hypothetical protein
MAYKTPEQIAAASLTPLGFVLVNQSLMPYQFVDKAGTEFNAMADFYHPGLDLYVEIKCDHLNGKTSKATAERAYDRVDLVRKAKYPTFYQTRNQWNHAAPKHAVVQTTIGRAQYAIAFTGRPDEETLSRLTKHSIEAYSLERFASLIELQLACQPEAA